MTNFDLSKIIRPNIAKLKPYTSARDEFSGEASVFLDANENSYGSATLDAHNRYPDPKHTKLRNRLSEVKNIASQNIFMANGSDETIDLIIRAFCEPGRDNIICLNPSYGMYQVCAEVNDVKVKLVNLDQEYQLSAQKIIAEPDQNSRIIFICNPNNPTGNAFEKQEIAKILKAAEEKNIIVVIDEAYIDFCLENSFLPDLKTYANLIILQTFSKAWGLAEIRLGMAYAASEIIDTLYKIKSPYNISGLSQQVALAALSSPYRKDRFVNELIKERERLLGELSGIDCIEKVFPSSSNFIFLKVKEAEKYYKRLLDLGIVVRDRSKVPLCEGCFRITVGTSAENDMLLSALRDSPIDVEVKSLLNTDISRYFLEERCAEVERKTAETNINIKLNLDGSGRAQIKTGLGFFDHMLYQIARHAGVDLSLSCDGDLYVDEHHTIEDTALALGEAFNRALGDKQGIERYGFMLPMDDALAQVALDFSGRGWLIWEVRFLREKIGDVPTEMFFHFFKSFSDAAKCNLNIKASGDNEHHKIEAIFKAFARTLKQAVKRNADSNTVPSTKDVL